MFSSTDVLQGTANERMHYFSRQLITADDMMSEQEYFRQKLRRHNRYLHGWGVVCGCMVVPPSTPVTGHPWQVVVCPGYIITPQGDEIVIAQPANFDLAGDSRQLPDPCANPSPCPPIGSIPSTGPASNPPVVYLAACYAECQSRPVRVHPTGCACDDSACDYSRIRDSFELKLLQTLPQIQRMIGLGGPACPKCAGDSCVVLAGITLPTTPTNGGEKWVLAKDTPITLDNIKYSSRTVLYSVAELPQPPTILSTSPSNGQTKVAANASVRVTFNRAMDATTIVTPPTPTMTVDDQAGAVTYDSAAHTATYKANSNFSAGMHTAKITASVKDTYGTPLVGDFTWNFWV